MVDSRMRGGLRAPLMFVCPQCGRRAEPDAGGKCSRDGTVMSSDPYSDRREAIRNRRKQP